jgi:pimeloyl-ACP methyl ester carboxylesterase
MPVLILWGEEDGLIPVAVAQDWQKAVPGAKLDVYPKTGHIPMEEVADQSAKDVRAFLSTP